MATSRKIFSLFGSIAIEGMAKTKSEMTEFDKSLRETTKQLNMLGKDMMKTGKAMTMGLTAPLTALAGTIGLLTMKTAEYADQMLDLQDVTGISTDKLQGLEAVARTGGVEFSGLTGAVSKFTGKMLDIVKGTGDASDIMKELGIDVLNTDGTFRNMDQMFPEVLAKLRDVENVTERNALAQKLFGKDLSAIAPILSMSTEEFNKLYNAGENLAGFMSGDQLKAANDLKITVGELKATFNGLVRDMIIEFVPIFQNTIAPMIKDLIIPLFKGVIGVVSTVASWFNNLSPVVKETAVTFGIVLLSLGPFLMMFSKLIPIIVSGVKLIKILTAAQITLNAVMTANPVGLVVVAIGALITAGIMLYKNWDKVAGFMSGIWDSIKNVSLKFFSWHIEAVYSGFVKPFWQAMDAITSRIPALNKIAKDMLQKSELVIQKEQAYRKELDATSSAIKAKNALTKEEKEIVKQAKQESIIKSIEEKKAAEKSSEIKKKEIEDLAEKQRKETEAFNESIANRREDLKDQVRTLEEKRAIEVEAAKKIGADVAAVNAYYDELALKQKQEAETKKKEADQKEFESLIDKIDSMQKTESQKLDEEYNTAITLAEKTGNDTLRIEEYYARKSEELRAKENTDKVTKAKDALSFGASILSELNNVMTMYHNMEMARIDAELNKGIAAINSSAMSKEEKEKAIQTLEEESEKKRVELQREQASRDKAMAIFNIGLKTAEAIMSAMTLAWPLNLVMALFAGGVGIAQTAIVAATPLPMAEGGLAQSDPGKGVFAQIGEGSQDELVLPMETGADRLADGIITRIKPALDGMWSMAKNAGNTINLYLGTLIADEVGIKNFNRELQKYNVMELQRTGR